MTYPHHSPKPKATGSINALQKWWAGTLFTVERGALDARSRGSIWHQWLYGMIPETVSEIIRRRWTGSTQEEVRREEHCGEETDCTKGKEWEYRQEKDPVSAEGDGIRRERQWNNCSAKYLGISMTIFFKNRKVYIFWKSWNKSHYPKTKKQRTDTFLS